MTSESILIRPRCIVMILCLIVLITRCYLIDGSQTQNITPIVLLPLNLKSNNASVNHPVSFSFKGLGLSISKSLRAAKTFGISIKLPLTSHFPVYDKRKYLPRFGSSFGMNWFPFDYKCTLSMSLPFMTAAYGAGSLLQQVGLFKTSDDNNDYTDKYMHSDDSMRRIGLSVSFKFNFVKGVRLTFGPWANCQAGQRIVDALLPTLLIIPTVTIFVFNFIRMIISLICKIVVKTVLWICQQWNTSSSNINDIHVINNTTTHIHSHKSDQLKHQQQHHHHHHHHKKNEIPLLPLVQPIIQPTIKRYKSKLNLKSNHPKNKQKLTIQQKLSIQHWYDRLREYVSKKSPKIAAGIGIFVPYKTTPRIHPNDYFTIGSYIRFEIKNIYLWIDQMNAIQQYIMIQQMKCMLLMKDTQELCKEIFSFALAKWNNRQPSSSSSLVVPSTYLTSNNTSDSSSNTTNNSNSSSGITLGPHKNTIIHSLNHSNKMRMKANENTHDTTADTTAHDEDDGDCNDAMMPRRPVLKKKPQGVKKPKHSSSGSSGTSGSGSSGSGSGSSGSSGSSTSSSSSKANHL